MKFNLLMSCLLTLGLAVSAPEVFAHVGHGDEFQTKGGINRVKINPETDSLLGIQVTPIKSGIDGSPAVLIPVTSVVDDNGRQLVFVQYENFYEPVPVTTGATQGELITVTQGLSVGEKLVSQGSLSLYAESRKTQTATSPSPATGAIASPKADASHAQADAQGVPHNHDAAGNLVSGSSPIKIIAAIGGGTLLVGGAVVMLNGRNKKGSSSGNEGDF